MTKEASVEAGDFLSPDEICNQINNMTPADVFRIEEASKRLAYGGVEPEDLRQDAVVSLLTGDRKCPRNVNFAMFMVNAMRSIASNQRKKKTAENLRDPAAQDEDGFPRDEHVISNDMPDKKYLTKDLESLKREVYQSLGDDTTAQLVFIGRLMGDEPSEIREQLGLSETDYRSVNKRITRKIKQIYPTGWPL